MSVRILPGDCRDVLRTLPDASVQCCVTSPPYYGLRDYGVAGQVGLEPSPTEYVAQIVAVFREVRRVLRDDGTLWLNVGDSYNTSNNRRDAAAYVDGGVKRLAEQEINRKKSQRFASNLKEKDLLGIPWSLAFALRDDGWWLRSDIIWHKPNPMPESVTDRPTSAHEHVFLLSKAQRYYFDAEAVMEESCDPEGSAKRYESLFFKGPKHVTGGYSATGKRHTAGMMQFNGSRNIRNVWTIAPAPFAGAHFATFPPELAERCIKAGTSERGCCANCGSPQVRRTSESIKFASGSGKSGRKPTGKGAGGVQTESGTYDIRMGPVKRVETTGWSGSCQCAAATSPCVVLDPFGGAGTTGLVADRLGRSAILIELNPEYADMARRRIADDAGMFASVA